ncbi:MAG: hypothetical protein HWN67_04590 [Candidatus Helarchaeota archaeon]|nr:hypothetical protein [Candidatus Helarchaeota archaeon]
MKIKGIVYMDESMGWLEKSPEKIQEDMQMIKEKLYANTIRLEGYESKVFDIAKIAKDQGLDVWIQPKFEDVIHTSTFLEKCKELAKKAQELGLTVFIAGGELSLELNFETEEIMDYVEKVKDFETYVIKPLRKNPKRFQNFMIELIKVINENFNGKIAYSSGTWEFDYVPWDHFDIIMNNQFYWEPTKNNFFELLKEIKKFGKSALQGECGFQTIDKAMEAGPKFLYPKENIVKYNEDVQAKCFKENLEYVKKADLDGVFIQQFDEGEIVGNGDLGFGIVKLDGTKKKSFYVISEFFKKWQ